MIRIERRGLMKRLLTTLVILTGLFAPALAVAGEGVNIDDLVVREGLHYEKFTEEPFTGKTVGSAQYTFRRGKKHGPVVLFYPNGQLSMKGNYKDGDLDGLWVWYRMDGQLLEKGPYKDSLREGFWVFSKRDGTTDMDGKCCGYHGGTGTYRNGKKVSD